MVAIYFSNKARMKIAHVWGPNNNWEREVRADIAYIHGVGSAPEKNVYINELQHTLISDLKYDEEELFKNISSKTFKYDIKRSYKDNTSIRFYANIEIINNGMVEPFLECCKEMYRKKNIDLFLSKHVIEKYIENKCLFMSVASINGAASVFHTYIDCEKSVRLWHSCSAFRDNKGLATIIGRANKRLHWEDMLFFKGQSYSEYDWGGVFEFDSDNGIDKFKSAFGGERKDYYNATVGLTLKGKAYLLLKSIMNK